MRRIGAAPMAALVVCLALVAGACTDDDDPSAAPSPSPSPTLQANITPPDDGFGATPSPTEPLFKDEDQVLKVAIREPSTLDPMRIQDPGSILIARQLFDGLTRWDQTRQRVRPAAARSWKVSDGGKTFSFKLRPDLTFHDGTPVTSKDFRFAFDRIALKSSGADVAYLLELVKGFTAVNQFGDKKHLAGIETPSKSTLTISLTEPYQDFPAVLTHPSLVPLQKAAVKDLDQFLLDPVGNGPFEMARPFEIGQPVVLSRYDEFYDPASIEGISFTPADDAAQSWVSFTGGELDISEVPASEIDSAGDEFGDAGYVPLLVGAYYGFNLDSPELRSPVIRRAINYAIDRDAIAGDIFKGTLQAPRGIVPEGMPGFDSDACGSLCRFRPKLAGKLVRRMPKKQRKVTLQYTTEKPQGRVARSIKADLQDVGLRVSLKPFRFSKFLRVLTTNKHSMFRLGWIAEYPDPDVFLHALFDSTSPDNHSDFSSDKVDKLLTKARSEPSEASRERLYREAEKLILRAVPIAPIGSFVMHWAAQPSVEGVVFDVLGGFDANTITLDRG